jgi:hypothetical protein
MAAGVIQSMPCSAKTIVSCGCRSNTPARIIAFKNTSACWYGCSTEITRMIAGSSVLAHAGW